ncbi:Mlf [Acrasis kona]|uniref:Mlf n=1 Tax=Acrasis kona TaxID=1008807 RepID=A0AAW2ZE40_9EUKA
MRHSRPIIEEIDSDEDVNDTQHHSRPTFEEPEDRSRSSRDRSNRSQRSQTHADSFGFGHDDFFGPSMMTRFFDDPFFSSGFGRTRGSSLSSMMNMPSMMSSFESSSSGGGQGSVFYSSTTTTTSANGVSETTRSVKDSRSGTERIAVKRSINGKSATVEKVRDNRGREQTTKRLENMTEDDQDTFDGEWNRVSNELPSWGRRHVNASNALMSSGREQRQPSVQAINDRPSRSYRN